MQRTACAWWRGGVRADPIDHPLVTIWILSPTLPRFSRLCGYPLVSARAPGVFMPSGVRHNHAIDKLLREGVEPHPTL